MEVTVMETLMCLQLACAIWLHQTHYGNVSKTRCLTQGSCKQQNEQEAQILFPGIPEACISHSYFSLSPSLPPSSSASMKNSHTENLTVSWSDPATRSNMGQHLAMKKPTKQCENNCSRLFVKNWQRFLSEGQTTVFNTALAAAPLVVHLGPSPPRAPRSHFRGGSSHHHLVLDGYCSHKEIIGVFSTTWLPQGLFLSSSLWSIRCHLHAWVSNKSLVRLATPVLYGLLLL